MIIIEGKTKKVEESEDEEEEEPVQTKKSNKKQGEKATQAKKKAQVVVESESEDEDEEPIQKKKPTKKEDEKVTQAKKKAQVVVESESEDEDKEEEPVQKKKATKKEAEKSVPAKNKPNVVVESESEEEGEDQEEKPQKAEKHQEETQPEKKRTENGKPALFQANQKPNQSKDQNQRKPAGPERFYEIQVTKLPTEVTEEELKSFFEGCGPIHECKLVKATEGHPGDIAYIKFKDPEAFQNALDINEIKWKDVFLTIKGVSEKKIKNIFQNGNKVARPKSKSKKPIEDRNIKKVYVGNLHYFSSEEDIRKLFENCGRLINFKRGMDAQGNV